MLLLLVVVYVIFFLFFDFFSVYVFCCFFFSCVVEYRYVYFILILCFSDMAVNNNSDICGLCAAVSVLRLFR